jgi:hypothetical protein
MCRDRPERLSMLVDVVDGALTMMDAADPPLGQDRARIAV